MKPVKTLQPDQIALILDCFDPAKVGHAHAKKIPGSTLTLRFAQSASALAAVRKLVDFCNLQLLSADAAILAKMRSMLEKGTIQPHVDLHLKLNDKVDHENLARWSRSIFPHATKLYVS